MQTQTLLEKPLSESNELALLGGKAAVQSPVEDLFSWPIITSEDEAAVLNVLRRKAMSGVDVTREFETEFAAWQGRTYALGCNTGTAAIHSAMFAVGVGAGHEVICPAITYWASVLQCFSLGATAVFADIDPDTLCIDPNDIEHRITPQTKAIVVVHYVGYPCDMDAIMDIARRHNIAVIEDVSHAQGGMYRGRKVGTFGDVAAMSLMTGKSFACGEAGILVTNDREMYERAALFGHYERGSEIESEALKSFVGLPMGGHKYRMHQVSAAVARVQLKYYDERCHEIDRAMSYFGDLIDEIPGLHMHRVQEEGSTMAGWYSPMAHYDAEALGGLSLQRFVEAVKAEGVPCVPGCSFPLHLHPLFNECDIYGHGQPTRVHNATRDVRQAKGSLPISEGINNRMLFVPWFKHYRPNQIEEYAEALRKVANNYETLLQEDEQKDFEGRVSLSAR